jgi:uncharacterized protein YndB with AHSA1/START domain
MDDAARRVRAEIEIDAPVASVWRILRDLDRYAEWNPFTPRAESTLRIGDPIHLHVRLVGERLLHRVETVTRNEPWTLGWEMKLLARFLLHSERIQTLVAIDAHRTGYATENRFTGWLCPLVLALFGRAMQRGFADCALGLRKAAESAGTGAVEDGP